MNLFNSVKAKLTSSKVKIFFNASIIWLSGCFILLIPTIRFCFISIGEFILHGSLDHNIWHERFIVCGINGIIQFILFSCIYFLYESKKAKKYSLIWLTGCFVLLLPPIHYCFITIVEFIFHRSLDYQIWHERFFICGIDGIFQCILFFCVYYLNKSKKVRVHFAFSALWLVGCIILFILASFSQTWHERLTVCGIIGIIEYFLFFYIYFLFFFDGRLKLNYRHILILLTIYVLTLSIRIYWFSQKRGLHVDEVLGITVIYNNGYMWWKDYDFNREYKGKEIKEISLCTDASLKSALKDIAYLYNHNPDIAHTNLYYTFYRLSLVGLKTGNPQAIIYRVSILNLLLFSVSFIFFFLLMKLFFPDSKFLQYMSTACAFLSTAAITNTLYFRSYQIQEVCFIVFCYYFTRSLDWKHSIIEYNDKLYLSKLILPLSVITALTLLSGYYSIFFIVLFGIYIIYSKCKEKKYVEIVFYAIVFFLGLIIARILFHNYFSNIFSNPAVTTTAITLKKPLNMNNSINLIGLFLTKHFFNYGVIIICSFCLFYSAFWGGFRKQQIQKPILFIFIASILYLIIVTIIVDYKIVRYVMVVFPFFIILPTLIVYLVGQRKIAIVAMTLLFLSFVTNAIYSNNIEYLYGGSTTDSNGRYPFYYDTALPVFILSNATWKPAALVPYLNDEQIYYFNRNYDDIKFPNQGDFYLIISTSGAAVPDYDLAQINSVQFEILQQSYINEWGTFICLKIKNINTETNTVEG